MEPIENKKLIYLDSIKNKLFENFNNNKLHHSIIFTGSRGVGKSTLCFHLANKILESGSSLKNNSVSLFGNIDVNDGLDDENPTFNLIKNRKHPDLLVIEREQDKKTSKMDKEIKIAAARKIGDFMNLSPFVSNNKVIIIDSIDEMNFAAQNAILKALEEPKQNTYVFLVCHNMNDVLDTIKSRCHAVNVPNLDFVSWQKVMNHVSPSEYKKLNQESLKKLFSLSGGSINLALNIIKNNGLRLYEMMENMISAEKFDVENVQILGEKLNSDEELFELFFYFLNSYLYDVLLYFATNRTNNAFVKNNSNFVLRNNQKSILEHIKYLKEIERDIRVYNLSKKHAVVVLFNKISGNDE